MVVNIHEYKVGVVEELEDLPMRGKQSSSLKWCHVNIGWDDPISVVTSAPNVRLQSRVVVAVEGSSVMTEEGEEIVLQKTIVGGKPSHGMLCDSKMLGWTGGATGVAVNLPDQFEIGSSPPNTKPRPNGGQGGEQPPLDGNSNSVEVSKATNGLFERKLTKEEKKKMAAEKRAAKKAAKGQLQDQKEVDDS